MSTARYQKLNKQAKIKESEIQCPYELGLNNLKITQNIVEREMDLNTSNKTKGYGPNGELNIEVVDPKFIHLNDEANPEFSIDGSENHLDDEYHEIQDTYFIRENGLSVVNEAYLTSSLNEEDEPSNFEESIETIL